MFVGRGIFPSFQLKTTLTLTFRPFITNMKSREEEFLSEMVVPSADSFHEGSFAWNEAQEIYNYDNMPSTRLLNGIYTIEEFRFPPETMARPQDAAGRYPLMSTDQTQSRPVSLKLIRKLTDDYLEKVSIQDLNKKLRRLPKELRQKFRKRRRILKNRKYSLKCRKKGAERENKIAEENEALELELLQAKEELRKVIEERDEYHLRYSQLKTAISASEPWMTKGC